MLTSGAEPCSALSPCPAARSTTGSHGTPASARARRADSSTVKRLSRSVRSMIVRLRSRSGCALWPVPTGVTRRPCAVAARITALISSALSGYTTAAGRRSAAADQVLRARS